MKIITRANSSEDSPIYALAEKVLRDRKEQAEKDAAKASKQAEEITTAMQQKPATPAVKTEQTPAAKPPVVLTREAGASEAKPAPAASTDKK